MAGMNNWNNAVTDAAVTLNGGAVSIGTDAVASAINIGTGAAARTVTIGNTTGASALNMNFGTGDFTLINATGTLISALDTGEIVRVYQPAFSAYLSATKTNKTGTGTFYTIGADALTEIFDQNSDFNVNGTFTAPVTGKYMLYATVFVVGCTAANEEVVQLMSSNRIYTQQEARTASASAIMGRMTVIADMDAADTVYARVCSRGEASDVGDIYGSADFSTGFAGYLLC